MRRPALVPALALALLMPAAAGGAVAVAAPAKDDKLVTSPKAVHKDLPPGVKEKASEEFARGRELDEAGDLHGALQAYSRAAAIDPHPNTTYNIADLYRRLKNYPEAITEYERYLKQAGETADRAAVEQILEALRATPGQLTIEPSTPTTTDEQAFVDGEPVGKLPITLDLRQGRHAVDVITPISYGWMTCDVRMGRKETCRPSPAPREDGNVVIGGSVRLQSSNHWRENGAFFMTRERFELRHGHYTLEKLFYKQCKAVEIDIPRGEDVLTYIFVTLNDERPKDQDACEPIGIRQRTIKLTP